MPFPSRGLSCGKIARRRRMGNENERALAFDYGVTVRRRFAQYLVGKCSALGYSDRLMG